MLRTFEQKFKTLMDLCRYVCFCCGYSNSVASLELYTEQYIYFHQLGKHCSVKRTLPKKDRDLYETTTETNSAITYSSGGGKRLENTEPRAGRLGF